MKTEELPNEITAYIFSFLDDKTIENISTVNHLWHNLAIYTTHKKRKDQLIAFGECIRNSFQIDQSVSVKPLNEFISLTRKVKTPTSFVTLKLNTLKLKKKLINIVMYYEPKVIIQLKQLKYPSIISERYKTIFFTYVEIYKGLAAAEQIENEQDKQSAIWFYTNRFQSFIKSL